MIDKNYCQIATNIFHEYANEYFEGKRLWKLIKIDFKYWIKKYWNIFYDKT